MEPELHIHPKLDAFLAGLDSVRRSGRGFNARCPAHEDKNPSLGISFDERGIGLYCFAGCSVESILEKQGLTWADLFFDDTPPQSKPRKRSWRALELEAHACAVRLQHEQAVLDRLRFGRVVGYHEDVFERVDGEVRPMELREGRGWSAKALELLGVGWDGSRLTIPVRSKDTKIHDVLRYDPFATSRKIIAGRGKSRLPWPSPEPLDAETVFLVEGEGTAISMWTVGFQAVALPGSLPKPRTSITHPGRWEGAGWHRKWADRFTQFRRVVLLPDCDEQGRALMRAASYDLEKAGVRAHVIDIGAGGQVKNLQGETIVIPPNNDGTDIADHLLSKAYDGPSRKIARNVIREMVADKAEVLVA